MDPSADAARLRPRDGAVARPRAAAAAEKAARCARRARAGGVARAADDASAASSGVYEVRVARPRPVAATRRRRPARDLEFARAPVHAHRVAAFATAPLSRAPTDARTSHGRAAAAAARGRAAAAVAVHPRDGGFGAGGAECVFLEGAAPLAVA